MSAASQVTAERLDMGPPPRPPREQVSRRAPFCSPVDSSRPQRGAGIHSAGRGAPPRERAVVRRTSDAQPAEQPADLRLHLAGGAGLESAAVPRQDPAEPMVEELLQRTHLLVPGVPADAAAHLHPAVFRGPAARGESISTFPPPRSTR